MPATPPTDRSLATDDFGQILLVKPSSLGDVIHALPVLHGLRSRFPTAKIDWLIAAPLAPLLEGHPEIDELIRFDRKRYGRMLTSPLAGAGFIRFVRMLRARRYDLVVDLQGLFRSGFLARATGARVRIGFREAREGARLFYTHRLLVKDPNAHAVDRNYLVGDLLGFADVAISFPLPITKAAMADAARLLEGSGVDSGGGYVAVAPGARWETKRWPDDRFANVISELGSCMKLPYVLLGAGDERDLCERIRASCDATVVNLAGRTTLPELAAVVSKARCVLCHDSAVAHLAAAFDRPLVCITGPTNASRTGPYRRRNDVVQLELDCAPCYLRKLSACRHNHRCMEDLPVGTVVSALRAAVIEGESFSRV